MGRFGTSPVTASGAITTGDQGSEIVERVAKAIRDSEYGTGSQEPWQNFEDDATAAIRAMNAWQPIDTAPKDGTWVLLHYNPACVPCIGFWMDHQNDWTARERMGTNQPKWWMPLPSPPSEAS